MSTVPSPPCLTTAVAPGHPHSLPVSSRSLACGASPRLGHLPGAGRAAGSRCGGGQPRLGRWRPGWGTAGCSTGAALSPGAACLHLSPLWFTSPWPHLPELCPRFPGRPGVLGAAKVAYCVAGEGSPSPLLGSGQAGSPWLALAPGETPPRLQAPFYGTEGGRPAPALPPCLWETLAGKGPAVVPQLVLSAFETGGPRTAPPAHTLPLPLQMSSSSPAHLPWWRLAAWWLPCRVCTWGPPTASCPVTA